MLYATLAIATVIWMQYSFLRIQRLVLNWILLFETESKRSILYNNCSSSDEIVMLSNNFFISRNVDLIAAPVVCFPEKSVKRFNREY